MLLVGQLPRKSSSGRDHIAVLRAYPRTPVHLFVRYRTYVLSSHHWGSPLAVPGIAILRSFTRLIA